MNEHEKWKGKEEGEEDEEEEEEEEEEEKNVTKRRELEGKTSEQGKKRQNMIWKSSLKLLFELL